MTTANATLSLVKDQKADLTKGNPGLAKVTAGLGWDINGGNASSYDLDAIAFHLKNDPDATKYPHGKLAGDLNQHVVFFNNKKVAGLELDKDNLTGAGEGDDEKIFIDLSAIPADVDAVMLGVNIYEARSRSQSFGMVKNAFMRLYDTAAGTEFMKYDLSEDYSSNTAVIFGKLYRHNGEWKFQALGLGTNGDINDIVTPYK